MISAAVKIREMTIARLEDDHIFPKSIYKENGVLNKTLLLTNEKKGAQVPADYFAALEKITEDFGEILETHLIDANGLKALKNNALAEFLKARDASVRRAIGERLKFKTERY